MATSKIKYDGWKSAGTATGGSTISLPSDYNELCVVTKYQQGRLIKNVPKMAVTAGATYFSGMYSNAGNNASASWSITANNEIYLNTFTWGGDTSLKPNTTTELYYR